MLYELEYDGKKWRYQTKPLTMRDSNNINRTRLKLAEANLGADAVELITLFDFPLLMFGVIDLQRSEDEGATWRQITITEDALWDVIPEAVQLDCKIHILETNPQQTFQTLDYLKNFQSGMPTSNETSTNSSSGIPHTSNQPEKNSTSD